MRNKEVSFGPVSKSDYALIDAAMARAQARYTAHGQEFDRLHHTMNLIACHLNGCPLDFAKLLNFDDFSFMHDISGIDRHMSRETGQLMGHFLPRCSKPADQKHGD